MELYGHFTYKGQASRQYGLMLANAETKNDGRLSGKIETSVVFGRRAIRNYFVHDNYSDSPLSIDIEILCDGDNPLDVSTQREVKKWLFYTNGYERLYIDIDDDPNGENYELVDGQQKRLYLNCRFTNPEKVYGNGGVCGYKATLETDGPFACLDPLTVSFTLSGEQITSPNAIGSGRLGTMRLGFAGQGSHVVQIYVDTDVKEYIYPKITIMTGNTGGNIMIHNITDDPTRLTEFVDLPANAQIVMAGEIGMISGPYYENFSKKNFVRLLDGVNQIGASGDIASIQFEWQNRRYL